MIRNPSNRIAVWLPVFVAILPAVIHALGIPCPSAVDRVLSADTVVLGRSVKIDRVGTRPNLFAMLFEFQVDQVLKGKLFKPGDTIAYRHDPDLHRAIHESPLPSPDEGASYAFLSRDKDGKLRAWCPLSAEDISLEQMERLIAVAGAPLAHLDSDREDDVCVVLASLGRYLGESGERDRTGAKENGPNPEDRARVIAFLRRQAASESEHVSTRALNRLAYLEPVPAEAFEDFAKALESSVPERLTAAAAGLKRLKDPRAIPLLIERVQRFRRDDENSRQPGRGDGTAAGSVCALTVTSSGFPHRAMPEMELLGALLSFDDPRVTQFALQEVDGPASWAVMGKIAELDDGRAVEILLRKTWEGSSADLSTLCKFDDPRIVDEASERMYDHPQAPHLLACRGDRESKEFMLRLLRQGNCVGARWAAKTRDPDAKADLIRGLEKSGDMHWFRNDAMHALGKLRAFDLLEARLAPHENDDDRFTSNTMLLYGFADRSIYGVQDDCPRGEAQACLRKSLHEIAAREHWDEGQRAAIDRLVATIERHPEGSNHNDIYHPWTPPERLRDMPDPLDEAGLRTYFERNLTKCRTVLRSGSSSERYKILQAANHVKATVLDGDLALDIFNDADRIVRSQVHSAVSADRPALTVTEIERWALAGDGDNARNALNFIRFHPKPEYRAIVTKVLYDGWHLFDELLFEAIIKTEATEAAALLRTYLEHEHILLRTNAAITLVHLHDEEGVKALPELLQKAKGSGQLLRGEYIEAARSMIEFDRAKQKNGEQTMYP